MKRSSFYIGNYLLNVTTLGSTYNFSKTITHFIHIERGKNYNFKRNKNTVSIKPLSITYTTYIHILKNKNENNVYCIKLI